MRCLIVLLFALGCMVPAKTDKDNPCKAWEFRCSNNRCISPNRFCDGTDDCGDSSDEVNGCTNCNQTLMGEMGTKYPLRITEPFLRNFPFVCQLHLVAGGGNTLGERLEITFLSFQIGSLSLGRNGSEDKLECQRGYLRLSESHEDFFLADDGSRKPASTLRSQQTRGFSQLISAFKEPPTRQLSTLYDLTVNLEPDFGLFCGSLISSNLGVSFYSTGNNVTLSVHLPPRSTVGTTSMMGSSFGLYLTYRFLYSSSAKAPIDNEASVHLGNPVANTYCDKAFVNCDRKRCLIRSPNFPGLYLRNFTCNYYLRQDHIPYGKRAQIVVSQPNEYKISVNTGSSVMRLDPRKSRNQGSGGLSSDCAGDVVRIFDKINSESNGGRLLLTEFCESGALSDVVSSGPEMLVQLYSAPANLLYESRLELEIRVEFTDANESVDEFRFYKDANCDIVVYGSDTRSGVIRSPRHSVPRNTTCTARLIGKESQKIWLYFVSYFVQDHETLGFDLHPSSTEYQRGSINEDTCDISSLELFLDVQRNTSGYRISSTSNNTHKFCEKTLPSMCTRASDYSNFVPKRPCLPPNESYLSLSSEVFVKYSVFMRASDVVSSLSATSFIIKYEFVDTDTPDETNKSDSNLLRPCGSSFNSSVAFSGSIKSSRNIFLYGRGGKEHLSCDYFFELSPKERIVFEIAHFYSSINSCTTVFDPLLRRYNCRFDGDIMSKPSFLPVTSLNRYSYLTFVESSSSSSVFIGCVCDSVILSSSRLKFTSTAFDVPSLTTLSFRVSGMTSFEDFNHFQFMVRFRFLPPNSTIGECSVLPESLEKNRTHGGELTFQAVPSVPVTGENFLRCQWVLQSSSPDAYLYLRLQGRICDGKQELDKLNRVVLYSSGANGLMQPKSVLCLASNSDAGVKPESDIIDFFSTSWHNNDSRNSQQFAKDDTLSSNGLFDKNHSIADRVIVELIAFQKGRLTLRWLEVTRPSLKPGNGEMHTEEGRTMRNVNCLFECPELSACINPELWCDGVVHCPHSGFDESAENCQHAVTLYISVAVGCLVACMALGLAVFFLFRRYSEQRHSIQRTHPTTFEHHPHCLQHNQGREVGSKNFQNASPVFMVSGSIKKKKKKNKDDFVRHIQTVEVRFPDIHM
ncbi:uncharacterized protein LOC129217642 [Uloborus diversus]|uniref:uncharacterized protein LOC129217642 n=1 Tax=Uloborus diversus TaxID=327109 RepID=UPI002409D34B|nr:uncharacterized protein LOC129217642 [Uloborus diversus]